MYKEFDSQFKKLHALVPYEDRIKLIKSIIDKTNEFIPSNISLSNIIKKQGYVHLGQLLDKNQVKNIKDFILNKPAYDSHVPPGSSGLNLIENIRHRKASASYPLETILTCPHILELALNRDIIGIAENYLECVPTLYSINVFHTFAEPQHNSIDGIKSFHRDVEDVKFLCLFVYLVDVDENTGPHIYIKYTHNEQVFLEKTQNKELCDRIFPPNMTNGHGNDELFQSNLSRYIDTLTGESGGGFFADTFGVHRGSTLSKDRLILWIRYGLHKNGSTDIQIPEPLSKDILNNRITFDQKLNFITRVLLK